MSRSTKLIEPKGESMGASDLSPVGQKPGDTGTCSLNAELEVVIGTCNLQPISHEPRKQQPGLAIGV